MLLRFFEPTIEQLGLECVERFVASGDQRLIAPAGAHPCRLLRWSEIQQLVADAGAEVVEGFAQRPALWARFLDWEERLCAEPGAVEGGTHLLFAVRRAAQPG